MADLKGYVNPRSLGNEEPCQSFGMDVFFEQQLWDRYIESKDLARRDLYTWDAAVLAAARMRRAALSGATENQFLQGFEFTCKIGHHKPCELRTFHHPQVIACCVGLAKEAA